MGTLLEYVCEKGSFSYLSDMRRPSHYKALPPVLDHIAEDAFPFPEWEYFFHYISGIHSTETTLVKLREEINQWCIAHAL